MLFLLYFVVVLCLSFLLLLNFLTTYLIHLRIYVSHGAGRQAGNASLTELAKASSAAVIKLGSPLAERTNIDITQHVHVHHLTFNDTKLLSHVAKRLIRLPAYILPFFAKLAVVKRPVGCS